MSQSALLNRLALASSTVKDLLSQIDHIEKDLQTPISEKISQIKKIREELTKVAVEIDSIKREIRLLNAYSVN